MKVCLLSDTHGHIDDHIRSHFAGVDEVWHAGDLGEGVLEKLKGDYRLRAVYGNIDGTSVRTSCPEYLHFTLEGVDVLIIHISGPFGSYTPAVKALLKSLQPRLLVCGHSHILKVQHDTANAVLYMNPGAAGKHGFHKVRTLLKFTVKEGKISDLQAVELGLRGAIND